MLNQPEELKTIEQKIEDARNTLTVIEQDQIRFNKLMASQGYELEQQSNRKAELTSEIAVLEIKKSTLMSEISYLDTVVMDKESSKATLESEIENISQEIKKAESKFNSYTEKVAETTKELTSKIVELDKRDKKLEQSEIKVQEKLEIIKAFKLSL